MRIGFIGVGGIATSYMRSLTRLNIPVAAIADVNPERARTVGNEVGSAFFSDHRPMLEQSRLDAVFINIPPGAHSTEVIDAVDSGAAVFVAKPVALNMELARNIADFIKQRGAINQVGYMARYSDITLQARDLCADRPLTLGFGRFLCKMSAKHPWWGKFDQSGGQIVEQSTHVFDLLRMFLGEVETVHAFGHKNAAPEIADFDDSTVVNLKFKSGAVGNVVSSYIARAPEGFAVELNGRDLYLRMQMDHKLTGSVNGDPVEYLGEETGYFRQVEMFVRAVQEKNQNIVRSSYEDALKTLDLTLAATKSLASGEPVSLT